MGSDKALLQPTNFTLGPDAILNTEIHLNSVHIKPGEHKHYNLWSYQRMCFGTTYVLDLPLNL